MIQKTQAQQSRESKQQLATFRKAARELGADESKEGFQDVLRKLAKAKPSPEKKAKVR
ncbi:MAG TPA: hypothetical protein VHX86_02710 [Tepidisphaeraceae bacterium]|jgi:hypothetical protein|nr:hypothetical protein [Tepidisphaeraceae bacterium]